MGTISQHKITAQLLTATPLTLNIKSATVTLDDSWSPYAQAELVCWAPPLAALETIDPKQPLRVRLIITKSFGLGTVNWNSTYRAPVTMTLDLGLRERQVNKVTGELSLSLASDEAILQDYGHPVIASERTYGLSIRAAVALALGKIGAALDASSESAQLTTELLDPVRTNLEPNPTAAAAVGNWGGQNSTMSRLTGLTIPGLPGVTTAIRGTATSAAVGGLYTFSDTKAPLCNVIGGQMYTASGWFRSSAPITVRLSFQWTNSAGTPIGRASSPVYTLWPGVWTYIDYSAVATPGSSRLGIYSYSETAWAAGDTFDAAGIVATPGPDDVRFFDGSIASGRDRLVYVPAWLGTPNNSASTLTHQPNNEATIWEPGVTAWEYIEPLVQKGNLRLWCDESRIWHLNTSWAVPGQTSIAPATGVTQATDTISRAAVYWYDSVVIKYSWTDAAGLAATAYDVAGSAGGRTLALDYPNTVYPGPGAAAGVLNRATGRGRVLDVTAISDYLARPGQALSISVPDAPIQTGVVSSVAWSFPDDTMTIESKGLTDTPATAWALAPAGRTWANAAGTWATYTN